MSQSKQFTNFNDPAFYEEKFKYQNLALPTEMSVWKYI